MVKDAKRAKEALSDAQHALRSMSSAAPTTTPAHVLPSEPPPTLPEVLPYARVVAVPILGALSDGEAGEGTHSEMAAEIVRMRASLDEMAGEIASLRVHGPLVEPACPPTAFALSLRAATATRGEFEHGSLVASSPRSTDGVEGSEVASEVGVHVGVSGGGGGTAVASQHCRPDHGPGSTGGSEAGGASELEDAPEWLREASATRKAQLGDER